MARARTTKGLAKRISLDYFQRPHPFRSWKRNLCIGAGLAAGVAGAAAIGGAAERVLEPRPVSPQHAFFGSDCSRCHAGGGWGSFLLKAQDRRCSTCHDGAPHQETQKFTPACADCHAEHRAVPLAAVRDAACTRCHADLSTKRGASRFASRVVSFSRAGHPEFAAVRPGTNDVARIRLNHKAHLKPGILGPRGAVTLACSSCHLPDADQRRMQPVTYAKQCASCHLLSFDIGWRLPSELVAPHDKPEVVHAFLLRTFREEIDRRPSRISEPDPPLPVEGRDRVRDAGRLGRLAEPSSPPARTPVEWAARQAALAETLLFRKDCHLCHDLAWPAGERGTVLPTVAAPKIPEAWLPHARFAHRPHRLLACAACHRAADSEETSDVLLPSLAACAECHRGGGARADCALCHLYHDRTRERTLEGPLTLPLTQAAAPSRGLSTGLPGTKLAGSTKESRESR